MAGSLMTYFSLDQLPRSRSWQRSLQNGNSGTVAESVGFLQMGQRNFMRLRIPQSGMVAGSCFLRPKNSNFIFRHYDEAAVPKLDFFLREHFRKAGINRQLIG